MSDLNLLRNRAVWFDIPVADLDRAADFYRDVLAIRVDKQEYPGFTFYLLEHGDGNSGCLVLNKDEISSSGGILLYLNVDGRILDAVAKTTLQGGRVLEPIHAIGPHGFRAIILDSEGNRVALHSASDA